MKPFTKTLALITAILLAINFIYAQQQIQFAGPVSQGEGIAGWNADGSGPEPAATGHLVPAPGFTNQFYYGSSHDYITGNPDHACFHFLSGMTGFPLFEQALTNHGFTPDQVKGKYELTTLGNDIEGIDWFFMNDWAYSNYYDINFFFELDGSPILAGIMNYANMYINTLGGNWHVESAFAPLNNIAEFGTPAWEIAQAFLQDLDGKEIRTLYQTSFGQSFSGNGRAGAYYNVINGILETGNPQIPFQGLNADHEGFVGWDADGTGPEPYGNGHNTQLYYGASLDYDDIDPDPNACLGHFMEGSTGFFNTLIQLDYRGYLIEDLKAKYTLNSLGPDVEGEDWDDNWSNYYNNIITIEFNGEPILSFLQDTNRLFSMSTYWSSETSIGKVINISQNASEDAQLLAQSFMIDLGTHMLKTNTSAIHFVDLYEDEENGRDGGIYEITEGTVMAVHEQATFIPQGTISGTWSLDGSPYYVEGHLTIENGETLTIEPGVRVGVRGPYHITVQGCLNAEGTTGNPIMFTASNPNIYWDGFDYDGTATTSETSFFDYCIFQYGRAMGGGEYNSGGIFAVRDYDDIEIYNSTFRNSIADQYSSQYVTCGGAIALWNSSPFIQNCIFYDNYGMDYAGALLVYLGSNPIISNCLFYNNESPKGGAMAFYENSNGILINSTIVNNQAELGGALYFYLNSNPQVINTIMWDNEASLYGNEVYLSNQQSTPGFYYCDIEGGEEGFAGLPFIGEYLFNLDEDPLFAGNEEHPFMIPLESPCYNMGTPDTSAWYYDEYLPEYCLCGNPRKSDGRIEMGAYEIFFTGFEDNMITSHETIMIYPNPVRDNTSIHYHLPLTGQVTISLLNTRGERIKTLTSQVQSAGEYNMSFNFHNLDSGLYFIKLDAGNMHQTGKLIKL
ncbi:MAG: T9SS type A sorting domain-containing protein [Bacteroidales bacterium]|nr:T9SS type A sorting domain-containing protein [Bacteroidales bacterium]